MKTLIELQQVSKVYGEKENQLKALNEIDLVIKRGEFVAVMGPSGSGKSTLLTILGAMNPPSTGKLFVDGIDVYALSAEKQADFRREYLGFVFQQFQLVPYLTALENVMLPLIITDTPNQEEKAALMLARVGLGKKLKHLPSELSGGEQGRVAIARAIVNEPPILLADEPTGTLDSKTGAEVLDLFTELHQEGQTIVMVTHSDHTAARAHRLVQLKDGVIVSDGLVKAKG